MEERASALCGIREIEVHSLPVEPTVVASLRAIMSTGTPLSQDHALEVMRDSTAITCSRNTPRFRALFAHLLEDRAPLVIHCTAGKDRTGFACALILHVLGVANEVISEDYLLTNRSLSPRSVRQQRPARRCQAGACIGAAALPGRRLRGDRRRLRRSRKLSHRRARSRKAPNERRCRARYLEV